MNPTRVALFVLLFLTTPAFLHAPRAQSLRVGTKPTEPFVLRSDDGEWLGISIELWERIAADNHWTFEYREMDLEDLLARTGAGSLDVAVAAFTVTPEREEYLDFSHAFYSTGLGVAVRSRDGGWAHVLKRLASPRFLGVVAFLVLLLLLAGSLVWLFERRHNASQFGGRLQGLGSGFWWSAVTMTTVGYGDKAPVTAGGRFVALVWMFVGIVAISSITAALTSALTVSQLESRLSGPQDLAHLRVGTLDGTAAAALLGRRGISHRGYPTVNAGLESLNAGQLDAFVYDQPILRYWVKSGFPARIRVLPWVFDQQNYALVLAEGSALSEPINRALLKILRTPEWQETLRLYLGNP